MVQTLSTSPNPTREGIHHLKLTTKREELVTKLSIVSRAVSTRAATQALSGVLLTAAEGRVTLTATDLDWTMVMPPMLTNGPARGVYRIGGEALPRNGSRISRADVADFMMLQIDNPQWIKKGVYISW